jgi:hypothetical protein
MSRAEHTYRAGAVEVSLIVPDGISAPTRILLTRESDGAIGTFTHVRVRALRAPAKRRPRIEADSLIPEDWEPPADEVEKLRAECPSVNLDHELPQLIDWYRGKGQRMKDWTAVWRRWVRETHKRNVEKGWKPSRSAAPTGETAKQKWLREHGVTEDEYERRKDDRAWVEMINRRGIVT